MRSLKDEFLRGSKEAAAAATKSYIEGDHRSFLMNAAISVELLGKSYLAGINPLLIASKGDFDSMLHLCGLAKHSKKSPQDIRTITSKEVISHCCQINPALTEFKENMERLAEIRNGVVHIGRYAKEFAETLFVPYVKYVLDLLDILDPPLTLGEYFGNACDFVGTSIKESTDEAAREVQRKLAKAGRLLIERFSDMDDETRKAVIRTIASGYSTTLYSEERATCPVCDNWGIMRGDSEFIEWKGEVDGDGFGYEYPLVHLYGHEFECRVCGLKLDSSEEIELALMESTIEVEDPNPEDFYDPPDDYYEDFRLRGRDVT